MRNGCRRVAIAACAALAGLGVCHMASAVTLIQNNQSAVVDGWSITAPTGVSLTVTTNDGQIDIEKVANFTVPNQGFLVGFNYVGGGSSPATTVDFTDELIANNTGQSFSGFDFLLMEPGATFPSVSNVFAPPIGTGYNYTSVKLDSTGQILSYTGVQDSGATSSWGSAASGDNLLIDAASGTDFFALKELSQSGGGGGGSSAVPMPTAAWQSLAGLAGLAFWAAGCPA